MSTLATLHSAVDSADLNARVTTATTTEAPTDTTAPATASSTVSLPSQADLGPKITKKLATEKHMQVPQSWGGLHRELTVTAHRDNGRLAECDVETAAVPAVAKSTAPAPALELEAGSKRADPPGMLPAHELVRQHRLSRDDRDDTKAVHTWSGISASLEAEYGGQSVNSPAAARPTAAPGPVAAKAEAVVHAARSVSQPAAALRPPRTLATTSATAQPNAWLGLSNALTTEFNNPSPSPPARRRAPKRVEAPVDAIDKENDDKVSNDVAEIMIPTKAPPATSFGYSDLSPLAIL